MGGLGLKETQNVYLKKIFFILTHLLNYPEYLLALQHTLNFTYTSQYWFCEFPPEYSTLQCCSG